MARLKPKEFDPTMLLKIQKLQTDNVIKASKQDDAKNLKFGALVLFFNIIFLAIY